MAAIGVVKATVSALAAKAILAMVAKTLSIAGTDGSIGFIKLALSKTITVGIGVALTIGAATHRTHRLQLI